MRSALFWHSTHSVLVMPYRCFGTTNRPHLQGKISWALKMGSIDRNYHHTSLISQKSAVLIRFAAEACIHSVLYNFHTFIYWVRTDWWQVPLCLTLLMSRTRILIIWYKCTELYFLSFVTPVLYQRVGLPQYVSYLPPPLTLLLRRYTQNSMSASKLSDPVWTVLLTVSVSQFGLSVSLNHIRHNLSSSSIYILL